MKLEELKKKYEQDPEYEYLGDVIKAMEERGLTEIKEIVVSDIEWDTDGEDVEVPAEVRIQITEDNLNLLSEIYDYSDDLSDFLSDKYEFCFYAFNADIE